MIYYIALSLYIIYRLFTLYKNKDFTSQEFYFWIYFLILNILGLISKLIPIAPVARLIVTVIVTVTYLIFISFMNKRSANHLSDK